MGRPLGVTLISILVLISAILLIIGGIALSITAIGLGAFNASLLLLLIPGIFSIILGIIYIIVFKSLRAGKNWARILMIILGSISIILNSISIVSALISGELLAIASPLPGLILQGIIVGYLLFSKRAKSFFR